jgi:hypothetical protein
MSVPMGVGWPAPGYVFLGEAALIALAGLLFLCGALDLALLWMGGATLRRLVEETPEDSLPLLKSRLTPAVTVALAPEEAGDEARARARRLLSLTFANHEVIVALRAASLQAPAKAASDDLASWREEFGLEPSLRPVAGALPMGNVRGVYEARSPLRMLVLEVESGSRELALNAAANAAQSPMVAVFDDRCRFETEALLQLARPMLEDPQRSIAVCGATPGESPAGLQGRMATLDFLRAWLIGAAALSNWNRVAPPAGSAFLITKEALIEAGGFAEDTRGLFVKLQDVFTRKGRPYRIAFVPAAALAVSVTRPERQAPIHTEGLPLAPRTALVAIDRVWPLVELLAYALTIAGLAAGWVDWRLVAMVLLATVGLHTLLSSVAVSLRELIEPEGAEPARLIWLCFAAFVENLGLRQWRMMRGLGRS